MHYSAYISVAKVHFSAHIMRLQNILTEYLSFLLAKMIYINPKGTPSTIIMPITMA